VPLPDSLRDVGERIAGYWETGGGEPPYILYVYPPDEEFPVRRDLGELKLWLHARGVQARAISLADLFWQAIQDSGWLESIVQQERQANGNPTVLEDIHKSVAEILREPPTLPQRVIRALAESGERTAAFLYRAGALYPTYRTSALLDDLHQMLPLPVTLLYPGAIVGSFGLRFMDRCEPAYGYRAHIISRGART